MLQGQIAKLNAKVRSLEVERDDAGFRELEAQDKLDALRNVVLGVHTTLEKTLPKAEPIVEAPAVAEVAPQAGTSTSVASSNSCLCTHWVKLHLGSTRVYGFEALLCQLRQSKLQVSQVTLPQHNWKRA